MRVDSHNLESTNFLQYFKDLGSLDTKCTRIKDLTAEERE